MTGPDTAPAARVAIVGAGIAGLSIARAVRALASAKGVGAEVVVLEKAGRVGGNIRSERISGYLCEWGPNGFLDNAPETLALIRALGLQERVQVSDDAARRRFIFRRGVLHQLPDGIGAFVRTSLLTWRGKLRIVAEPFARARPDADETIHGFAARRIGREAADVLISSMVAGIFAGDARRLSLGACFPRMRQMEDEHGGLFRAMLALRKSKRRGEGLETMAPVSARADDRSPPAARAGGLVPDRQMSTPPGPGSPHQTPSAPAEQSEPAAPGPRASSQGLGMPTGRLTSFREGMEELTQALSATLRGSVRTAAPVMSLQSLPREGFPARRFRLSLAEREEIDADAVVLSGFAGGSSEILRGFDPELAAVLAMIEAAPLAVVCLGYEAARLPRPLSGFGFLVPPGEGPRILGVLWDSSIYPGRAPAGKVLIRAMLGGARDPAAASLPDGALVDTVRRDLSATMGLDLDPDFVHIVRHPLGIPQYTVGHLERLRRAEERAAQHPGLFLAGNSYRGVSINSCIAEADGIAGRILRSLEARRSC